MKRINNIRIGSILITVTTTNINTNLKYRAKPNINIFFKINHFLIKIFLNLWCLVFLFRFKRKIGYLIGNLVI